MKKVNSEKRVVIYCRESRDDYGENYERIETQRDLLIKYCNNNGYTNIVEIIMDDDKSGTDFSRFNEIRKKANNKEIDVIIFKNSARLGRNQKEALDFVEYLEEKGVEIIFEDEQYNEEMFGLYAWFNERRARDDSKNIRRNLRHKMEEGKLIIRAIYGYEKINKKLCINTETSKIVKRIFKMYYDGTSFGDICKKLNNEKVNTPSQSKGYINTKKSNEWNVQNVIRILKDRRYVGDYVGGYTEKISFKMKKNRIKSKQEWIIIKNNHEPIISRELFEKVQDKMKKKNKKIRQSVNLKQDIYLQLLCCGKCGSKMYKKNNNNRPEGYICSKYSVKGRKGCDSHRIRKEYIDNIIKEYFLNVLNQNIVLNNINTKINIYNINEDKIKNEINILNKDIDNLKKIYKQIYEDKLNNIIPEYIYIEKKQEIDYEIKQKQKELKSKQDELVAESTKNNKDLIIQIINSIVKNGLTNNEISNIFKQIIVFNPKEITNRQKHLYNLNDMMYNELYEKGGLVFLLNMCQ